MSSNYYNQDPEDKRSYQKTVAMCVAAASLVILLFLVVLYVNSDKGSTKPVQNAAKEEQPEDDILKDSHNITSSELEFWDDAKKPKTLEKEKEGQLTPYKDPNREGDEELSEDEKDSKDEAGGPKDGSDGTEPKDKDRPERPDKDSENEDSMNKDSEKDEPRDKENYLAVTDDKGKKTYYEIMKEVPKNDYDFEKNLTNDNGTLFYKDGKRESIKGVDLSKYNGAVDFAKLKDNGIGFAMLRLGSRGYGSGTISLDEKFVEYAQNAQLNGIMIGAYFYSQAINANEAVEEANYIVGAVSGFTVKYPIAIDIETVSGDEARTDKLTSKERTEVVKTFCDTVKGYGYKPVIYASRDMLISGLNLEDLVDYDVWLSDENTPTDYPYRFSMWQYNKKGKIDGITGDIDLDISFINYEQK